MRRRKIRKNIFLSILKSMAMFCVLKNISTNIRSAGGAARRIFYYARTSWFIAMSKLRKELLKNNETINWMPEHVKEGRFGEWLREAKDWNFSRERYWGAPLPIWECEKCGHTEVVDKFGKIERTGGWREK